MRSRSATSTAESRTPSRGPHRATMSQIEAVAGDTTVGHATAYAWVMEALAGDEAPLRASGCGPRARTRAAGQPHGRPGGAGGDVAFLPTASACGKIRGDFLNLTALSAATASGAGWCGPGGCRYDLEPDRLAAWRTAGAALAEAEQAIGWLWDAASVRSRFKTWAPFRQAGDGLGLVGPAARACGLVRDVALRPSGRLAPPCPGAGRRLAGRRRVRPRPRALA